MDKIRFKRRRRIVDSSSDCSPKSLTESGKPYEADRSDLSSAEEDVVNKDDIFMKLISDIFRFLQGCQTSDLEQYDSLPYDDVNVISPCQNKRVKRRHRLPGKERSVSSVRNGIFFTVYCQLF